jgi:hypothetical protein
MHPHLPTFLNYVQVFTILLYLFAPWSMNPGKNKFATIFFFPRDAKARDVILCMYEICAGWQSRNKMSRGNYNYITSPQIEDYRWRVQSRADHVYVYLCISAYICVPNTYYYIIIYHKIRSHINIFINYHTTRTPCKVLSMYDERYVPTWHHGRSVGHHSDRHTWLRCHNMFHIQYLSTLRRHSPYGRHTEYHFLAGHHSVMSHYPPIFSKLTNNFQDITVIVCPPPDTDWSKEKEKNFYLTD